MSDIYSQLANEQFTDLDQDDRIIVFHPNYKEQKWLLSFLIDLPHTAYLRMDEGYVFDTLWEKYMPDMSIDEVEYVILDEYDRTQSADGSFVLSDTIETLLSYPQMKRVFIFSRTTSSLLNIPQIESSSTVFIPTSQDLMLWDYASPPTEKPVVEVYSLGYGRVFVNGQEIKSWDGVLPRSLFFYLVDKGLVTRNEIFDVFWPNLTVKEATNVFHVTKRKINDVLGVDLTVYSSGFYRISPDIELRYDTVQLSQFIQNSEIAEDANAKEWLEKAILLYRGQFLESMQTDWVIRRRYGLQQTYGEGLTLLADLLYREGHHQVALGYYLRALKTNPYREDIVQKIMEIYQHLGMTKDALAIYSGLAAKLEIELNVTPAPYLQTLAEKIQHS